MANENRKCKLIRYTVGMRCIDTPIEYYHIYDRKNRTNATWTHRNLVWDECSEMNKKFNKKVKSKGFTCKKDCNNCDIYSDIYN